MPIPGVFNATILVISCLRVYTRFGNKTPSCSVYKPWYVLVDWTYNKSTPMTFAHVSCFVVCFGGYLIIYHTLCMCGTDTCTGKVSLLYYHYHRISFCGFLMEIQNTMLSTIIISAIIPRYVSFEITIVSCLRQSPPEAFSIQVPFTMMASANGNIFRVTGSLWVEFTCQRWIPLKKGSDAEVWLFFYLRLE